MRFARYSSGTEFPAGLIDDRSINARAGAQLIRLLPPEAGTAVPALFRYAY
jgi:hypothetical protein